MSRLKRAKFLYLVTDSKLCGDKSLAEVVELAVSGGVNLVQLREKDASREEFLRIGRSLKKVLDSYGVPLIINDSLEIALELNADGLHLGRSDISYAVARKALGDKKIIGLSVNTLEQAREAENLDADYLGVGPIFFTQTKSDIGRLWQKEELKKLREFSRHILIGIGGININNIEEIIDIDFDGVAVVSAICGAKDPGEVSRQLLQKLK